jgi:hypothetical protein
MMNLMNGNLFFGALWALADTLMILGGGFRIYSTMTRRLDRIEYAIFNDGKTGMKDKIDSLVENQQKVMTDIEILKVTKANRGRAKSGE